MKLRPIAIRLSSDNEVKVQLFFDKVKSKVFFYIFLSVSILSLYLNNNLSESRGGLI